MMRIFDARKFFNMYWGEGTEDNAEIWLRRELEVEAVLSNLRYALSFLRGTLRGVGSYSMYETEAIIKELEELERSWHFVRHLVAFEIQKMNGRIESKAEHDVLRRQGEARKSSGGIM